MPLSCLRCLGARTLRLDQHPAPVPCPVCRGSGLQADEDLDEVEPPPPPPPLDFAARATDPSLPLIERALAAVIAASAGRFVRSDYYLISSLLQVGVPLPPMTVDAVSELARTWLEEAWRMRQRIDFAPLHLLRAMEQPALRAWVHEVVERGLAGYRAPG